MFVRERAYTVLQSRSFQRTCVAVAIVAAGSVAITIEAAADGHSMVSDAQASADEPGEVDPGHATDADGTAEVRRITVTPADRIEPPSDPEPVDAMATALAARYEGLIARAPDREPDPEPESASLASTNVSLETWEAVARCESGYGGEPDWSIDTGNGYYGGLQFNLDSWRWVGGTGYPNEASKATQIEMAERLWERQGWNAWPACSRKLGLR